MTNQKTSDLTNSSTKKTNAQAIGYRALTKVRIPLLFAYIFAASTSIKNTAMTITVMYVIMIVLTAINTFGYWNHCRRGMISQFASELTIFIDLALGAVIFFTMSSMGADQAAFLSKNPTLCFLFTFPLVSAGLIAALRTYWVLNMLSRSCSRAGQSAGVTDLLQSPSFDEYTRTTGPARCPLRRFI